MKYYVLHIALYLAMLVGAYGAAHDDYLSMGVGLCMWLLPWHLRKL